MFLSVLLYVLSYDCICFLISRFSYVKIMLKSLNRVIVRSGCDLYIFKFKLMEKLLRLMLMVNSNKFGFVGDMNCFFDCLKEVISIWIFRINSSEFLI